MEHPGKHDASDAISVSERPPVRQGSISFPSKVVSRCVEKEIAGVVRALCQGSPAVQYKVVQEHFLPEASFVHPFCRVPAFDDVTVPGLGTFNSRTLILAIFKWYRILSPRISLEIESAILDPQTNRMYLEISQVFAIWFIPFYRAPVHLTTVLHLVQCRVTGSGRILERLPQASTAKPRENDGPSYAEVAAAEPNGKGKSKAVHSSTGEDDTTLRLGYTRYMIAKQEDLYQTNEFLKFILPGLGAPAWYLWQIVSTLFCVFGVLACWPVLVLLGQTGLGPTPGQKEEKTA
ncbi:hypothetical protein GQ53DRAFT_832846 [Thozetella sp. PMI_491]|nr:hypothetical protein GQ53DRAFT_832846 [Thozetella sp. PMI_491]